MRKEEGERREEGGGWGGTLDPHICYPFTFAYYSSAMNIFVIPTLLKISHQFRNPEHTLLISNIVIRVSCNRRFMGTLSVYISVVSCTKH